MHRLIPAISSHSYGGSGYNDYRNDGADPYNLFAQSNHYFQQFCQNGIQALLILLVQQHLQDIRQNSGQSDSGDQGPPQPEPIPDAEPSGNCDCPCTSPFPLQEAEPETAPIAEAGDAADSLSNRYATILEQARRLQQLISDNTMARTYSEYNHYISRYLDDQSIIQSVHIRGGRIVEKHGQFFVAEDDRQVRYIIERS